MSILGLGAPGLGLPFPPNNLGFAPQGGTNYIELAPGQVQLLPSGVLSVQTGPYSFLQFLDPVTGLWRGNPTQAPNQAMYVNSDGQNYRVANLTGCALGAIMTNLGSGYTGVPTVTASSGGSTWTAIVGGSIGTITVGTAGANYTYPPKVFFQAPPPGGVPATGYATLSSGSVSAITLVDAGAGYTSAPSITLQPSQIDPNYINGTITNAAATCVINATNAQKVTAVLNTSPGTALTAVPTLSFAGGSGTGAAATVVMCFAITAETITGGTNYIGAVGWQSIGGQVTATDIIGNPAVGSSLLQVRPAFGALTVTTGTLSAASVIDAGLFSAVPSAIVLATTAPASPSTSATVGTPAVGGVNDYCFIQFNA